MSGVSRAKDMELKELDNGDAKSAKSAFRKRNRLSLSVDSVSEDEKTRLLDFNDVIQTTDSKVILPDVTVETNEELKQSEKEEDKKQEKQADSFQPSPKLNTFVGFLRLANYVCASTVLMGLAVSIFYPTHPKELPARDFRLWQVQKKASRRLKNPRVFSFRKMNFSRPSSKNYPNRFQMVFLVQINV